MRREGGHQLDDAVQLWTLASTCGSYEIQPSGSFQITVLVHQIDSMEDKLFTKLLDAFQGHVGAKNQRSKRAPPTLMTSLGLEIFM